MSITDAVVFSGANRRRPSPFAQGLKETLGSGAAVQSGHGPPHRQHRADSVRRQRADPDGEQRDDPDVVAERVDLHVEPLHVAEEAAAGVLLKRQDVLLAAGSVEEDAKREGQVILRGKALPVLRLLVFLGIRETVSVQNSSSVVSEPIQRNIFVTSFEQRQL